MTYPGLDDEDQAALAAWEERWEALTPEQQAAELRMMDEHAAQQNRDEAL